MVSLQNKMKKKKKRFHSLNLLSGECINLGDEETVFWNHINTYSKTLRLLIIFNAIYQFQSESRC